MNIWKAALLIISFFIELKPILIETAIVTSGERPAQVSPTDCHFFYDDHYNICHPADNQKQLDMFSEIFARGEQKEGPAYHVMIESAFPINKLPPHYPHVLTDLYEQTISKGLKNTTIENIEIRTIDSAASYLLYTPFLDTTNECYEEKQDRFTKNLAALLNQSFPCDLRTLTLQDVLTFYESLLEYAEGQKNLLGDEAAKRVYAKELQRIRQFNIEHIGRCLRFLKKDEPILQAAIRFAQGEQKYDARKMLHRTFIYMFKELVDLNIFFKISMFEHQKLLHPEQKFPDKILIMTGGMHMANVIGLLHCTGKYRELTVIDKKTYHYVGLEQRRNPLKLHLYWLVEVPHKNLEWELKKRAWTPEWLLDWISIIFS